LSATEFVTDRDYRDRVATMHRLERAAEIKPDHPQRDRSREGLNYER
jgi:hypothetical protein